MSLEKFMANLFAQFYLRYDGKVCVGFGYAVEDILFSIDSLLEVNECYKILMNTFKDWS
jgi:hypothetical protein